MAQQIQFIYLTQSDFDNLTSKGNKIYFTSDTKRIYRGSDLYAATSFDQLNFSSIEASDIKVNGNAVSLEGHTHSASEIDGLEAFVSAATQNFSQNGHKHAIADVTNLSGIVAGITNTTVSKSSGSFNTLTVGGSNVSVEGHTHSIDDIEDYEDNTFWITGSVNTQTLEIQVDQDFEDAVEAADAGKHIRAKLDYTGNGNYVCPWANVIYNTNGTVDQFDFHIMLDTVMLNPDANWHPYLIGFTWNSNGFDVRPYELSETNHEHDIEDITNLSTILTGVSESSLTKDTITGDIGNFRLLSVSGSANFAVNNVSANAVSVNGTPVSLEGHTHGVSEVTGLAAAISAATSGFASSQHSHSHVDITDFNSAVVTAGSSSFAPISHSHAISSITGLTASLSELSSSIQSLQSQIVPVQCITLAQYEALQPADASTIYFISDGNRIYRGSVLYAATTFDQLNFSSIEASGITVNGNAVALSGHTHAMSEIGASTAAQTAISAITNASTIQQMKSALTAFLQNFVS